MVTRLTGVRTLDITSSAALAVDSCPKEHVTTAVPADKAMRRLPDGRTTSSLDEENAHCAVTV